jgi:hypothetical protein
MTRRKSFTRAGEIARNSFGETAALFLWRLRDYLRKSAAMLQDYRQA